MDKDIPALQILFTEVYYWVTVVFMFLIHVGFCTYEVGVSRRKNHLATLMKNAMVIPIVSVTFYLFGWWFYSAMVNGPGITGGLVAAPFAEPWNELMAPHMGGKPVGTNITATDTAYWARLNGVFWAAFLLFSWTTASIVSGSIIERMKSGAFWLIAAMLGSVTWIIDAAWGWHPAGWMVKILGYHDAYASGVVHAIAGGTVLAVLINLGPRIGKFREDGTPRNIPPQNPWLVCIGLFLIYTGFWGFYAACNIPIFDVQAGDGVFWSATNIYLQAVTLSGVTFNFIMSLSGGLMAGYMVSKADPYWTFSGGLAGIIACSAGNDLYHPIQAFLLAALIVWDHLQDALLGRAAIQDRRRGRGGRRPRLCGLSRGLRRRLPALGLPVFPGHAPRPYRAIRARDAVGAACRRGDHVLRSRLHTRLHPVVDPEASRLPSHLARNGTRRSRPRRSCRGSPRRGRIARGASARGEVLARAIGTAVPGAGAG